MRQMCRREQIETAVIEQMKAAMADFAEQASALSELKLSDQILDADAPCAGWMPKRLWNSGAKCRN